MVKFLSNITDADSLIDEVIIDLPGGKRYLNDHKKRFPQSRQKGGTCWYYAYNVIRPRYGKAFDEKDHPKRKIEKQFSQYRKQLTAIEREEPSPHQSAAQHDAYLQKKINLTRTALAPLITVNYENAQIPLKQRDARYSHEMIVQAQRAYGLSRSDWVPGHGILGLIRILREKGPCATAGWFGKAYYKTNEKLIEIVNGQPIYGWTPGTYVKDDIGHAIVIVGAKRDKDKAYVYYIDPNDGHNEIHKPRIYKTTFKNFCERLSRYSSFNTYLLHANQNEPLVIFNNKLDDFEAATSIQEKIEAFTKLQQFYHSMDIGGLFQSQIDLFEKMRKQKVFYQQLSTYEFDNQTAAEKLDKLYELFSVNKDETILSDKTLWQAFIPIVKELSSDVLSSRISKDVVRDILHFKYFCEDKKQNGLFKKLGSDNQNLFTDFYTQFIHIFLSENSSNNKAQYKLDCVDYIKTLDNFGVAQIIKEKIEAFKQLKQLHYSMHKMGVCQSQINLFEKMNKQNNFYQQLSNYGFDDQTNIEKLDKLYELFSVNKDETILSDQILWQAFIPIVNALSFDDFSARISKDLVSDIVRIKHFCEEKKDNVRVKISGPDYQHSLNVFYGQSIAILLSPKSSNDKAQDMLANAAVQFKGRHQYRRLFADACLLISCLFGVGFVIGGIRKGVMNTSFFFSNAPTDRETDFKHLMSTQMNIRTAMT